MDFATVRRGARDVAPLLVGVVPFGVITGVAAADAGLSAVQALGLSVVVFAGASQLAALELVDQGAPVAVVVATAVVINLRMVMYSASLAPYFGSLAGRTRAGLAYLLTDMAYALSVSTYRDSGGVDRAAYYLGVAVPLWVVWQVATVAGALVRAAIPATLGLDFAVPLVFLALLVPAMDDRPSTVAGLLGGAVAVLAGGLALNLGLLVGATVGVASGYASESVLARGSGDGGASDG